MEDDEERLCQIRQWIYAEAMDDSIRTAALTELMLPGVNFFGDAWDGNRFVTAPDWPAAQAALLRYDSGKHQWCGECECVFFTKTEYVHHECRKPAKKAAKKAETGRPEAETKHLISRYDTRPATNNDWGDALWGGE